MKKRGESMASLYDRTDLYDAFETERKDRQTVQHWQKALELFGDTAPTDWFGAERKPPRRTIKSIAVE